MSWMKILVVFGIVAIVGCSQGEEFSNPEASAKDRVKQALEGIVESGQGGSEIGAIMEDIGELEKTDPELATQLGDDLTEMMASPGDQVKARAEAMLKKLEDATGGEAAPKK